MVSASVITRNAARGSQQSFWGWSLWAIVLAVATVFFVVPAVWLLLAPTKSDSSIVTAAPLSFGSFADLGAAWTNLMEFQNHAILIWLKNSAVYSVAAVAISVLTSIPAGYALATMKLHGRRLILSLTLVVMIMPAGALVLPLFLEMNVLGLIGSAWAVILPVAFYPFGVYLAFIYYSVSLPADLLNAARVDGCTEWQLFTRIGVPLARPVIALVTFFGFVANWNNYFLSLVMLPSDQQYPIQVGLQNLLASTPAFNPTAGGGASSIGRPELALACLLAVVPVLVVFLFSQKALVSGLMAGATKE